MFGLILRSRATRAASRRMAACSWFETAQARLLAMRALAAERAEAIAEEIEPARRADFGLASRERLRRAR